MMMGVVGARVLYKRGGTKSAFSEICMATNAALILLSFISTACLRFNVKGNSQSDEYTSFYILVWIAGVTHVLDSQ